MTQDDGRDGLISRLHHVGYYPELVAGVLDVTLAGESVVAHLVQAETELDEEAEVFRHLTALVMTPTRLVFAHVDEHAGELDEHGNSATASTEAVLLRRIRSVGVSHVVVSPEKYTGPTPADEVTVAVGWSAGAAVELEPATCINPECTADHGLTGRVTPDRAMIRVSAEGKDAVRAAVDFARTLSRATSTA
ncbi:DUF5998 family protein [Promicromonospora sp. AC04]|uniref:DUF5998 family protein n=1 Tax=Promicromonospora sp. AC04 TaxID=2135723 RepID=UPI000D3BBB66|nr:DUF5998 family protein [Promicromonospora sp. AC04]